MKFIAVSFVALLSFFVLCYTHYDDYSNQTPVEPRLLETAADLKDFLEVRVFSSILMTSFLNHFTSYLSLISLEYR